MSEMQERKDWLLKRTNQRGQGKMRHLKLDLYDRIDMQVESPKRLILN